MSKLDKTTPITLSDGSMYISNIGPDRRMTDDNKPGICATVMKKTESGVFARTTMREDDFLEIAQDKTSTPDQKQFANRAIDQMHAYQQANPNTENLPIVSFNKPTLPNSTPTALPTTPIPTLAMNTPTGP